MVVMCLVWGLVEIEGIKESNDLWLSLLRNLYIRLQRRATNAASLLPS